MGNTQSDRAAFALERQSTQGGALLDGALNTGGWILGTYVHGLFRNTMLRRAILENLAARKGVSLPAKEGGFSQSAEYDKLANLIRSSLDMAAIYRMAGL